MDREYQAIVRDIHTSVHDLQIRNATYRILPLTAQPGPENSQSFRNAQRGPRILPHSLRKPQRWLGEAQTALCSLCRS